MGLWNSKFLLYLHEEFKIVHFMCGKVAGNWWATHGEMYSILNFYTLPLENNNFYQKKRLKRKMWREKKTVILFL